MAPHHLGALQIPIPTPRDVPRSWAALICIASLAPATAHAAGQPTASGHPIASRATSFVALERSPRTHQRLREIVVTATRRAEPAQDIGMALTAVSGQEVHALRLQQPLDLAMLDPSLSTMNAQTGSTPLFLLRGIGLDDFNNNNSSGVGIYLDGVFASFPGFLTGAMYDLARVEILKGPQGTLYGKNTDGGAINILSAQPTNHLSGYIDLNYSRWNTVQATGAVSGPINNWIKARLAGTVTTQGEGYQTDIATGLKYGKLDRGGARAIFDLRLNHITELNLNFHWVFDHSTPASPSTPNVEAMIPPEPFPTTGLMDSPPGGTLVRVGGLPLYKDDIGAGTAATLNIHFRPFTLTSISAYDYFSDHSLDNYDGYPAADNNWTKNYQQWQWSQEIRLTSKTGGRLNWVVGAIYSQNWYRNRDALDWTFVYGLANTMTQAGLAITAEHFVQRQQSAGVYANADTHLSSRLTLITGARYSRDVASFDGVTVDPTGLLSYAANNFSGPIIPDTILAALNESRSNQNVSYRVGLDYRLRPQILLYASVATGYKSGIYYGQPAQVQVDWGYVRPETNLTSELGIKSRYLDNSLQLDMDVFDSVIHNRQSSLSLWAGPVGTQPLIAGLGNVPQSRIDGIEAELDWRPIRGLRIHLAATRLDARVTETLTNDNGLALFTPVRVGQMLPDAPNFAASYVIYYQHSLTKTLIGFLQANDRYVTDIHPYLGDPTTFGHGDDLGARLGVRNPDHGWEVSLWSSNLTDTRPMTYAFAGSEGQRVSFYQQPRSIGIDFTCDF